LKDYADLKFMQVFKLNYFKKKQFFLVLFFLFSVLLGSFSIARADENNMATGVQVSPIRFDWDFNAGEERTGVVNLKNYSSDISYSVEINAEDFYVTDDTTEARFFIPNEKHPLYAYDVINWLELPENLTLAPNEGRDVFFKVKIPKETPTGGYYGALFFKTNKVLSEETSKDASRVVVNQRVGVLLVMAVKGASPINLSGKLDGVLSENKIFWDNPAKFSAEIFNSGNLHYQIAGNFKLYKFGKEISSQEVLPRIVYPNKKRIFEHTWEFSPWAYGRYKVKANFWSEDKQVQLVGVTSFWVIPWKTTVASILLLLIIWSIYRFFDKNFEIKKKE